MSDFLLPEQLLGEILKRLPVETLVQCTRVCKQWHSLITSHHFTSVHLKHSLSSPPQRCRRLLLRYFTSPRTEHFSFLSSSDTPKAKAPTATIPFPFRVDHDLYLRIVGCVHGLLFLSDAVFSYTGVTVLWNPLVRRYLRLPPPRLNYDSLRRHYACFLGFGYDSKNCDYKVVRIVYLQEHTVPPCLQEDAVAPMLDLLPPRAELYSAKEGCWREISGMADVECSICEGKWSQCFVNGCVHWAAYEVTWDWTNSLILVFDMSKEKFKRMALPECLQIACPLLLFVLEIGGCPGLLEYFPCQDKRTGCNVWVKKEYDSAKSWTRMYRIVVEGGIFSVLNVRDNGEVWLVNNGKLACHNPEKEEMNVLGFRGNLDAFYCQPYVESLLLLDKNSGAASYGGAKSMENKSNTKKEKKKKKKKKKKKHHNKGSTHSKQQDEVDGTFLLVPEETFSDEREWIRPGRMDLIKRVVVKMAVQGTMAKV